MAKKIEKLIYTNERGESITFSHASIFTQTRLAAFPMCATRFTALTAWDRTETPI